MQEVQSSLGDRLAPANLQDATALDLGLGGGAMNKATTPVLAAVLLCGMGFTPRPACSMPMSGLAGMDSQLETVQTVGWRCNPNRCSRRTNYTSIRIVGHWSAQALRWQIPLRLYSYSGARFYGYSYGPEIAFDYGATLCPNLCFDAKRGRSPR
jgi:hypothetical protein